MRGRMRKFEWRWACLAQAMPEPVILSVDGLEMLAAASVVSTRGCTIQRRRDRPAATSYSFYIECTVDDVLINSADHLGTHRTHSSDRSRHPRPVEALSGKELQRDTKDISAKRAPESFGFCVSVRHFMHMHVSIFTRVARRIPRGRGAE
jgi:hypothetical protein